MKTLRKLVLVWLAFYYTGRMIQAVATQERAIVKYTRAKERADRATRAYKYMMKTEKKVNETN